MLKLDIKLDMPSKIRHHNIGSVLHGVIMELLPQETVQRLHDYRYNPLKQRLYFDTHGVTWQIISLEKELTQELTKIFNCCSEVHLRRHDTTLKLLEKNFEEININFFVEQFMQSTQLSKFININFISPTSFKSDGKYDIFPEIRKILRSAMLTFDYFSDTTKVYDYDALEYMCKCISIVDYSLKSAKFGLEGVKIPGFKGGITLKVAGNLQILQLAHLLINFGQLSGIGIKTSMGMGGVRL